MSDPTQGVQTVSSLSDADPENQPEEAPSESVSVDGYKALKDEADPPKEGRFIDVRDREFRVADQLPGIILLDLGLASDPNATQGEQLRAVRQFLHAAIHVDHVDAFEVYLRSAQPVIEMEELNKIVEKLVEDVAGRPTE